MLGERHEARRRGLADVALLLLAYRGLGGARRARGCNGGGGCLRGFRAGVATAAAAGDGGKAVRVHSGLYCVKKQSIFSREKRWFLAEPKARTKAN